MMQIRDAHIESFGPLTDVRLEGLPAGLTLIYGCNEAGKSTLLDFFRATLTGYPQRPQGRDAAYVQRGRAAGSLTIETPQGLVRLSRRSGSGGGTLTLCDAGGNPLDAGLWQVLFGGITREIYSRIYAFGLGELQSLATLNDGQIRNALYGAGFGVGIHSPGDALKKLTDMMGALFKPGGSRQPVAQALRDWEQLSQQIREAQERLETYDQLALRQRALRQDCQRRDAEFAALEKERRKIEKRLAVWQRWDAWRILGIQLERMPGVPETVPADAPSRLRELSAKADAARRQLDREQAKLNQLQVRLAAMQPDEDLAGALETARQLGERRGTCRSALEELPTLLDELERTSVLLERELAALGQGWTMERVRQIRPGVDGHERLARLASAMASAEKACEVALGEERLAVRELELANAAMSDVQSRAESLTREAVPRREVLDGKLAALRELRGLAALQPVEASRLHEQRERLAAHLDRRPDTAPRPVFLALGGVLTLAGLGVTGMTAGLGWPGLALSADTLLPLEVWQGVAGVLGGGILMALGMPRHREAARQHDHVAETLRAGIDELAQQLEALQARMTELCVTLELEGPDVAQMDALEASLGRERERGLDLERRWQAVKTLHEERERRRSQARRAVQEANSARVRSEAARQSQIEAWQQALAAIGLDTSLSPSTVRDALQRIERAVYQQGEIDRLKVAVASRQAAISAFFEPLQAVQKQVRRTPSPSASEGCIAFDALLRDMQEAAGLCAERERLQSQIAQQIQEVHTVSVLAEEAHGEFMSLLRLAETEDPEEFLRRAAIKEETSALRRQREALRAELWVAGSDAARLEQPDAAPFAEPAFRAYLEEFAAVDRDSLELRLHQLVAKLAQLDEERQKDEEALHRQAYELGQLSSSEELVVLRERQQAAVERLKRHAFDWARLALARQMLERAKERFERERQPEVIRVASRLFSLMTQGAWSTVSMALDSSTLTVLPPVGEGVTPELLSRGTQEQLYLALRLAHVRQQARLGGVALPLIMDDILVNFDPERAGRTAEVLEEMMTPSDGTPGHQILFFTCHPHIVQLLRQRIAGAAVFVMERGRLQREA